MTYRTAALLIALALVSVESVAQDEPQASDANTTASAVKNLDIDRASALADLVDTLVYLGAAQYAQGKYEEAASTYREAAMLATGRPVVSMGQGTGLAGGDDGRMMVVVEGEEVARIEVLTTDPMKLGKAQGVACALPWRVDLLGVGPAP